MRMSDWSSDVCSSDLMRGLCVGERVDALLHRFFAPDFEVGVGRGAGDRVRGVAARMIEGFGAVGREMRRSEEHTSELQSLMRISYAVFCLKKKKQLGHITQVNHRQHYI